MHAERVMDLWRHMSLQRSTFHLAVHGWSAKQLPTKIGRTDCEKCVQMYTRLQGSTKEGSTGWWGLGSTYKISYHSCYV